MKALLLIIAVVLFVLGVQDAIRLLVDSSQSSIFSFITKDQSLLIGLDVILALSGVLIAGKASKMKQPPSK